MSFTKPLNLLYLPLSAVQDVQQRGLVLELQAAGTVIAAPAVTGRPIGVAYMTTADPLFQGVAGTPHAVPGHLLAYQLGVEIGIVREGVVTVPKTAAAITCGDIVGMFNSGTAGQVATYTPGAWVGAVNAAQIKVNVERAATIVGVALESQGLNTTEIKILLTIHNFTIPG